MKKIEIFNKDGSTSNYVPLSERITTFLNKYPDTSHRVVIETFEVGDSYIGQLMDLYKTTIEKGKTPAELGLPEIPAGIPTVFKATLYDSKDKAIATASAMKLIRGMTRTGGNLIAFKDWECGETAARQRLLAAVGMSGDVFDADENNDLTSVGKKFNTVDTDTLPTKEGEAAEKEAGSDAPVAEATKTADPPQDSGKVGHEPPQQKGQGSTARRNKHGVMLSLVVQVQTQAKLKGQPVPDTDAITSNKYAVDLLGKFGPLPRVQQQDKQAA